ncbi:MAG: alanine racemase [Chryseobacterium sp. SCN 40-13]|nr:MAG: alanine racemase [Chryseobacterium sp. SCN 40-13]
MFETTSLTINKSAYQNNLKFIRQHIGEKVKFCSIVKGNAYGHGIAPFVTMAADCGVDYFGVYSADEAFEIKKTLTKNVSIMIMGMVAGESLDWAIANEVEFFVFDMEILQAAVEVAQSQNKKCIIHLDIETGMNRTGIERSDLRKVCDYIKAHQNDIYLKGVCTHYAGSESYVNHERVQQQIVNFHQAVEEISSYGLDPEYIHSACSAAMMNYPETMSNMVRVGIMQYGYWSNKETLIRYSDQVTEDSILDTSKALTRLLEWKTTVMSVKAVEKGEFIGYGNSYQAYTDMMIAVIPVGYSYGYTRALSNKGKVLIGGEEAPICGMINMNALCVDITHIQNVQKGDEVVLIGHQEENMITIASFCEMSNLMNYELLTRIPHNIPRTVK